MAAVTRCPGLDLPPGGEAGLPGVPLGALVVGDDGLGVDQGRAVSGPAHQELQNVGPGDAVVPRGHPGHGRHPQPVPEGKTLELQRRKNQVCLHGQGHLSGRDVALTVTYPGFAANLESPFYPYLSRTTIFSVVANHPAFWYSKGAVCLGATPGLFTRG